jgi:hypothetical protein
VRDRCAVTRSIEKLNDFIGKRTTDLPASIEGSVAKGNSDRDPQGRWHQEELIGGKPPAVK